MAPISVAYLAGPLNAGPVFNAIGFSACIAIVVGVRMHRPAARWPWYLIALGLLALVAGDVLAYNYHAFFGTAPPFPSIADAFYLAVYPATVAGLLLLIRHRNRGRNWASSRPTRTTRRFTSEPGLDRLPIGRHPHVGGRGADRGRRGQA